MRRLTKRVLTRSRVLLIFATLLVSLVSVVRSMADETAAVSPQTSTTAEPTRPQNNNNINNIINNNNHQHQQHQPQQQQQQQQQSQLQNHQTSFRGLSLKQVDEFLARIANAAGDEHKDLKAKQSTSRRKQNSRRQLEQQANLRQQLHESSLGDSFFVNTRPSPFEQQQQQQQQLSINNQDQDDSLTNAQLAAQPQDDSNDTPTSMQHQQQQHQQSQQQQHSSLLSPFARLNNLQQQFSADFLPTFAQQHQQQQVNGRPHVAMREKKMANIRVVFNNNPQFLIGRDQLPPITTVSARRLDDDTSRSASNSRLLSKLPADMFDDAAESVPTEVKLNDCDKHPHAPPHSHAHSAAQTQQQQQQQQQQQAVDDEQQTELEVSQAPRKSPLPSSPLPPISQTTLSAVSTTPATIIQQQQQQQQQVELIPRQQPKHQISSTARKTVTMLTQRPPLQLMLNLQHQDNTNNINSPTTRLVNDEREIESANITTPSLTNAAHVATNCQDSSHAHFERQTNSNNSGNQSPVMLQLRGDDLIELMIPKLTKLRNRTIASMFKQFSSALDEKIQQQQQQQQDENIDEIIPQTQLSTVTPTTTTTNKVEVQTHQPIKIHHHHHHHQVHSILPMQVPIQTPPQPPPIIQQHDDNTQTTIQQSNNDIDSYGEDLAVAQIAQQMLAKNTNGVEMTVIEPARGTSLQEALARTVAIASNSSSLTLPSSSSQSPSLSSLPAARQTLAIVETVQSSSGKQNHNRIGQTSERRFKLMPAVVDISPSLNSGQGAQRPAPTPATPIVNDAGTTIAPKPRIPLATIDNDMDDDMDDELTGFAFHDDSSFRSKRKRRSIEENNNNNNQLKISNNSTNIDESKSLLNANSTTTTTSTNEAINNNLTNVTANNNEQQITAESVNNDSTILGNDDDSDADDDQMSVDVVDEESSPRAASGHAPFTSADDIDDVTDGDEMSDAASSGDDSDEPSQASSASDSDDEPYNQSAASDDHEFSVPSFEIPQIDINPATLEQRGCRSVVREVQEIPVNGFGAKQLSTSNHQPASKSLLQNKQTAVAGIRLKRQAAADEDDRNSLSSRKVTSIVMTKECHFPDESSGRLNTEVGNKSRQINLETKRRSLPSTKQLQSNNLNNRQQILNNNNNNNNQFEAQINDLQIAPQSQSQIDETAATSSQYSRFVLPTVQQNQHQNKQQLRLKRRELSSGGGDGLSLSERAESLRNEIEAVKQRIKLASSVKRRRALTSSNNSNNNNSSSMSHTNFEPATSASRNDEIRAVKLYKPPSKDKPYHVLSYRSKTPTSEGDDDDDDENSGSSLNRGNGGKYPLATAASQFKMGAHASHAISDEERDALVDPNYDDTDPPPRKQRDDSDDADDDDDDTSVDESGVRPTKADGVRFGKAVRVQHSVSRPRFAPDGSELIGDRLHGVLPPGTRRGLVHMSSDPNVGQRVNTLIAGRNNNKRRVNSDDDDNDSEPDDEQQQAASRTSQTRRRPTIATAAVDPDDPDSDPDYNPRELDGADGDQQSGRPKRTSKSYAFVHRDRVRSANPTDFSVSYGRGNVEHEHQDYDSQTAGNEQRQQQRRRLKPSTNVRRKSAD